MFMMCQIKKSTSPTKSNINLATWPHQMAREILQNKDAGRIKIAGIHNRDMWHGLQLAMTWHHKSRIRWVHQMPPRVPILRCTHVGNFEMQGR